MKSAGDIRFCNLHHRVRNQIHLATQLLGHQDCTAGVLFLSHFAPPTLSLFQMDNLAHESTSSEKFHHFQQYLHSLYIEQI